VLEVFVTEGVNCCIWLTATVTVLGVTDTEMVFEGGVVFPESPPPQAVKKRHKDKAGAISNFMWFMTVLIRH
jgi:hypothetical protein